MTRVGFVKGDALQFLGACIFCADGNGVKGIMPGKRTHDEFDKRIVGNQIFIVENVVSDDLPVFEVCC